MQQKPQLELVLGNKKNPDKILKNRKFQKQS